MDKFIDTEETLGATFSDARMRTAKEICGTLVFKGWFKCPDWLPAGTKGYRWQIIDNWFVLMKPKPKLRHILRYKFKPKWLISLRAKRFVKNALRR